MSSTSTKVPFGQKVAFGIGMLANQMFPAVLGIFMVVLVQDLGFPGWMWGVLFFLPRIMDSITDPIMGFISDNTKSKWGRRRQYVFVGAMVMGLCFIMMWQMHKSDGVDHNFMYFLLWSLGFYIGLTIFSVPYVAMGYEMSNDFHERTNIMAVAQWIGQWAWVIAPWFWVIMYDQGWFPSADVATRELAIWVGIICMLFAMVPAIFIKSKSTVDEDYSPLNFGSIGSSLKELWSNFKQAFRSRPFVKLCISTFFIFNAFNTIASFSFFIIIYHLFDGDSGAAGIWPTLFGSVGALITTFAVIPTVAWLSKKVGKKMAFMISQSISILGYILLWFLFVPGKPYMFLFALPFFSFGIGSLFTLMMSMTADVIDLDELQFGKRREGVFGAIYWFMVKIGFAFAGGLGGLMMSLVGFESGAETQTESAMIGMRFFFSGFPILGTLVALYLMRNYDITEERANEIRAELDKRKAVPLDIQSSSSAGRKLKDFVPNTIFTGLSTDVDFDRMSRSDVQKLFRSTLDNGLSGICFSPYTEGQSVGDQLTRDQIVRRMKVLSPYTNAVRSFSCTDGNEMIPVVAKEMGMTTMVGAWIGSDQKKNEAELENLIKLVKDGMVDIAVVGNEVLLRGDVSLEALLAYIKRVREAAPDIKVAYVDAYYIFAENPRLVDHCDIILANCYPFWEGSALEVSTGHLQGIYDYLSRHAKGKKIIISETGWPSQGGKVDQAEANELNAMKYFINVDRWRRDKGLDLYYFSSFDESWKVHQEGDVGARWGIWDASEKLKY